MLPWLTSRPEGGIRVARPGPPTQLEKLPARASRSRRLTRRTVRHRGGGRAARPVQAPTIAPAIAAMVSLSPPRPAATRQPPRRRRATARTRRRRPGPTASFATRCRVVHQRVDRGYPVGAERAREAGGPQDQAGNAVVIERLAMGRCPSRGLDGRSERPFEAEAGNAAGDGHGNRGSAGVRDAGVWSPCRRPPPP